MAEGPSEETRQNCTFFKKPARSKNLRKRTTEEDDDDEGPAVVRKTKTRTGGHKSADKVEEKTTFFYESSREIQSHSDSMATAANETETEFDKDARAIRERILKNADEALKKKDDESVSAPAEKSAPLYKGINAYTDHRAGFRRENTIAAEKAGGAHGPLRASANFRNSVRVDYQPDICKDYKETGYCGYGDSCKFLHDRGDYKSGWQLDRDWEEAQKAKKQRLLEGLGEEDEKAGDEEEDELPFACFICRESFVDPVVTSCKHYFCEHCALKHHSKNKNCFVCNKATNGLFNTAHEIIKKAKNAPPS